MKLVLFLSLSFVSLCCGQQKKNDLKECAQLSNQAIASLQDYLHKRQDTTNLVKAAEFYDSAIKCDSLNFINYQGKLTVINMLGQYRESIKLIDKLYDLSGKTDVHLLVTKALVFEKIGIMDSSKIYFDRAFRAYDAQLAQNPPDSLRIISDKLYLIAITQGKKSAMEGLQSYLVRHPNDPSLKLYEKILRDFDRNTILSGN